MTILVVNNYMSYEKTIIITASALCNAVCTGN